MISSIFNTLLFDPLYNILLLITLYVPGYYVGVSIIILTLIVKFALAPLSRKSIESQMDLKKIEPDLKEIREKYTDKQEQAQQTMALYKEKKINPFSGCVLLLIQLPIILALYFVFYKGVTNGVNTEILYSFMLDKSSAFAEFCYAFLWIPDITGKSAILALMAGLTQFFQMRLTLPQTPPVKDVDVKAKPDMKEEFAKNMQFQMRYILPVIITFVAYSISAAVALYWVVSNMYSIGQEVFVRRGRKEVSIVEVTK